MSAKNPQTLAVASWLRLLGLVHAFQGAMIAGDLDEAARLRREAHDVLDANLDQRAEAAQRIRSLIEDEPI